MTLSPHLGKDRKVLLVGIDGATLDLIKPWVAEGELPHFASYFRNGTWGALRSTFHPISPSAWASFQTGMNPGKHGVIEFIETDLKAKTLPVSSKSIKAKPFWEYVGRSGKKIGIINVFGTYPVRPVNGFILSGMLSPDHGACSYPDGLLRELRSKIGDYIIDAGAGKSTVKGMSIDHFIDTMRRMTKLRAEAAKYLAKSREWDLFVVVFVSTDRVQHFLWKYMDRNRLDVPAGEREKYGGVILSFYRYLDSFLGEMDSLVGDDTVKLVISDHGFGPVYRDVNLARWLYDHGYAYPKRLGLGSMYRALRLLMRRHLPSPILKLARSYYFKSSRRPSLYAGLPYDWSRTKVFPVGHFGKLYVNLRGREPGGIVETGEEYEELCQKLTAQLMEWKNPVTGTPLIKGVKRREEVYWGPFESRLPDLSIEWADYAYTSYHLSDPKGSPYTVPWGEEGYGELEYSANHRPNGILMAKGKGIKKGFRIEGAEITDIAPTVLHMMGLGVPQQMDGRVLCSSFDSDDCFLTRSISLMSDAASKGNEWESDSEVYSTEDVKRIEEHLRSLGYL